MRRLAFLIWLSLIGSASAQIKYVQPPPPVSYLEFVGKIPDGAFAAYVWTSDGGLDFTPIDAPKVDVKAVKPGVHSVVLDIPLAVILDGKIKFLAPQHWSTTVDGGAEPPKPPPVDIAALAGKDAPALAAFYTAWQGMVTETKQAEFLDDYARALVGAKLDGNGAAAEILKRLTTASAEPFKPDIVITALKLIVMDLKAPIPQPPGPPPVTETGLRVLIVEDVTNRHNIDPGKRQQILAKAQGSVWDFLATECAKMPDGKTPDFHILDTNDDVTRLPAYWNAPWALRPADKTQLPWLYVSATGGSYSGPLPKSAADTLAIIKKAEGK